MRWHCPPDTWFEIEPCWSAAKHVISRSCIAVHNIQSLRLSREEPFCSLKLGMPKQETNLRSLTFKAGTRPPPFGIVVTYIQTHYLITDIKMMCYVLLLVSISWLAKRFQLLIYMTLMMYYIGLNIYIFICVVKTHLCSTEAIDNVGLYNDVVIRAYNTDVLVIRGWQYSAFKIRV